MSEQNNALQKYENKDNSLSVFESSQSFAHAQRVAKALSSSDLVPKEYRGDQGISNCLVAQNISKRVGADLLMVMQNLDIIHGSPSWSSQFIIGALNSCGRFSPLRYETEELGRKEIEYSYWTGKGNNRRQKQATIEVNDKRCRAVTTDNNGNRLDGPYVSIEMAVKEGWYTKSGSKWKTMPELMIRYRAAAFFGRLYAPEILMGMKTTDEIRDIAGAGAKNARGTDEPIDLTGVDELNDEIESEAGDEAEIIDDDEIIDDEEEEELI